MQPTVPKPAAGRKTLFQTWPHGLTRELWRRIRRLITARTSAVGFAAIALAAVVAGCGGGQNTTPSKAKLRQKYLAILKPANAKFHAFTKKASAWNDQTTNDQAGKEAAPVVAAIDDANNKLLRVNWPVSTQADVKKFTRAMAAMSDDLSGLSKLNMHNAGSWARQFNQDLSRASADASIVRADIGLPPNKP